MVAMYRNVAAEEQELQVNPGYILWKALLDHISTTDGPGYFRRLDKMLRGDGDVVEAFLTSAANYATRRMISAALATRHRLEQEGRDDDGALRKEISDLVRDDFDIPTPTMRKRIAELLFQCVRQATSTRPTLKGHRKEFSPHGEPMRCYVCGRQVTFDVPPPAAPPSPPLAVAAESAEVEHVWPRAMGGSDERPNLKVACAVCNRYKSDALNGYDFHFEEFCVGVSREERTVPLLAEMDPNAGQANRFWRDFVYPMRLGVMLRHGSACSVCNRRAEAVGPLSFQMKASGDSWHFVGVDLVCGRSECSGK